MTLTIPQDRLSPAKGGESVVDGRVCSAPNLGARPSVADIQREVAAEFGITLGKLSGRSQRPEFAHPRQLAMYLCRELIKYPEGQPTSFEWIGRRFDRDHSTVQHAYRRVRGRLSDPQYRAKIDRVVERLAA